MKNIDQNNDLCIKCALMKLFFKPDVDRIDTRMMIQKSAIMPKQALQIFDWRNRPYPKAIRSMQQVENVEMIWKAKSRLCNHLVYSFLSIVWMLLLSFSKVECHEYPSLFEGILGVSQEIIANSWTNATFFLPYNPVILEVGGYKGVNTKNLANSYPKGHVFVFEPNPNAFKELVLNVGSLINVTAYNTALNTYNGMANLYLCRGPYCNDPEFEKLSSLLEPTWSENSCFKGPIVEVPCTVLDDWCEQNHIDRIDFIQLDVEGLELQILQSSPRTLQNVIVICTKTNFSNMRIGTTQYHQLKQFLEAEGFEMLSHWYRENLQGEVLFVRKYMYDALFR